MPFFSGWCYSTAKLNGKTAIITGCNTGIGKETVKDFYKRGAKVIMACRNIDKAQEAKADIENACKSLPGTGEIHVMKLDLSSLKSVREFAQHILDTEPQVNILVNNAGVMMCPYTKTEDGFEMQFGTNHLGHFLLTLLLLPRIRNSIPARIVTVSSVAHEGNVLHLKDLNYEKIKYSPIDAYSQSKMANVMFSKELAEKLKNKIELIDIVLPLTVPTEEKSLLKEHQIEGINTYSLHPGVIKTDLARHLSDSIFRGAQALYMFFVSPFMKSPESGAQTTIYCAVDEKCAHETGLYYSDCAVKKPASKALNEELRRGLWEKSLQLVGLDDYNPFTAPDPGLKNKLCLFFNPK